MPVEWTLTDRGHIKCNKYRIQKLLCKYSLFHFFTTILQKLDKEEKIIVTKKGLIYNTEVLSEGAKHALLVEG